VLLAAKDAKEHGERVVKFVHHALLEWDDGIVRDSNLLGTNFRTTFGYIAETEAELILEQASAVAAVERMHFEAGDSNEEAWTGELFLFVVFAKDVTDVLAEKTFDALTELLHAVDIELGNFPFDSLARFERGDFPVDTVIPGNVGDKIFDSREGFHGQDGDGLVLREVVHTCFASQTGTAVDFGGAGATLPCFAVPADGEVRREMSLDVVKRVENDHSRSDGHAIVHGLSAAGIPTKDAQSCFGHL
jgi:hypothetical protein